ncbi:MAG: hypothetical protein HQK52_04970 [Oligoflexia bacterium]|nr:hypothetical protein [Oligoflexia bacterium]
MIKINKRSFALLLALLSLASITNPAKAGFDLVTLPGEKRVLSECPQEFQEQFASFFNNPCTSSLLLNKAAELQIPRCSDYKKGAPIDPTLPSSSVFVTYRENNEIFIEELAQEMEMEKGPTTLTIIVEHPKLAHFFASKRIQTLLHDEKKNSLIKVISTAASRSDPVDSWTQDKLHFAPDGKELSIYEMAQTDERKIANEEDKLSFLVGNSCELPVYRAKGMAPIEKARSGALAYGGNLMAMPGNFYITGVIPFNPKYENNMLGLVPVGRAGGNGGGGGGGALLVPGRVQRQDQKNYLTDRFHQMQITGLESEGHKVLKLDVSFLSVGHVDEMFSVVRTKGNAPCNLAILYASPEKAMAVMKKEYAQLLEQGAKDSRRCQYSAKFLMNEYENKNERIPDEVARYNQQNGCLFDEPIETLLTGEGKKFFRKNNEDIQKIITSNLFLLQEEMKRALKCPQIATVAIPVLYNKEGKSLLPNSVNGLVMTKPGEVSSKFIAAKTFYPPFEKSIEEDLQKLAVTYSSIQELSYHLSDGDVHCATKSLPLCLP